MLLVLENATVVRPGGGILFRDLSWTIRAGETWSVVGPVGSGKTSLTDVLLGHARVESGTVRWPFLERLRAEGRAIAWPADVIRRVSFKEESWLFTYARHYYQQRFNFIEPQDDRTLAAFLQFGITADDAAVREAARQLELEDQLPLSLIKLSNGQMRRARIARALLARPEWLILDDPFMGLDIAGRREVADLLGRLIEQGKRVLLITRPEMLPDWVTHVLELDPQTVRWQGPRSSFLHRLPPTTPPAPRPLPPEPAAPARPLIELRHVNVGYDGRPILRDISWTVRAGERWAVLGPNGSGKTTLLSLLCGDHPQAYANDVRLFGRRRGTGESIWEIKQQIGLVSPELHLYFSEPLTAAQTAATGFGDVLTYRPTTPAQDATVRELFAYFGIETLAGRPFQRLSTGEQRLVLLIRALVKQPPLLILDEPFQGLDRELIGRAQAWLEQRLRPDQTLLFVSHHPEEIPAAVNHCLRLENGRITSMNS